MIILDALTGNASPSRGIFLKKPTNGQTNWISIATVKNFKQQHQAPPYFSMMPVRISKSKQPRYSMSVTIEMLSFDSTIAKTKKERIYPATSVGNFAHNAIAGCTMNLTNFLVYLSSQSHILQQKIRV